MVYVKEFSLTKDLAKYAYQQLAKAVKLPSTPEMKHKYNNQFWKDGISYGRNRNPNKNQGKGGSINAEVGYKRGTNDISILLNCWSDIGNIDLPTKEIWIRNADKNKLKEYKDKIDDALYKWFNTREYSKLRKNNMNIRTFSKPAVKQFSKSYKDENGKSIKIYEPKDLKPGSRYWTLGDDSSGVMLIEVPKDFSKDNNKIKILRGDADMADLYKSNPSIIETSIYEDDEFIEEKDGPCVTRWNGEKGSKAATVLVHWDKDDVDNTFIKLHSKEESIPAVKQFSKSDASLKKLSEDIYKELWGNPYETRGDEGDYISNDRWGSKGVGVKSNKSNKTINVWAKDWESGIEHEKSFNEETSDKEIIKAMKDSFSVTKQFSKARYNPATPDNVAQKPKVNTDIYFNTARLEESLNSMKNLFK